MQKYSLEVNNLDDDYALIAIHTALEDYKLAYRLNQILHSKLVYSDESYSLEDGKQVPQFSVFNYTNENFESDLYLIANSYTLTSTNTTGVLALNTQVKSYLIPEKKKVDYFIKITGNYNDYFIKDTLEKINSLQEIISSYTIDKNKLKSKEFLIF